jgi:hypothetical protein
MKGSDGGGRTKDATARDQVEQLAGIRAVIIRAVVIGRRAAIKPSLV